MSDLDALLPGLFAAGDAGDLDSFDRYLHEDVVVHAPAGLSTREVLKWKQHFLKS